MRPANNSHYGQQRFPACSTNQTEPAQPAWGSGYNGYYAPNMTFQHNTGLHRYNNPKPHRGGMGRGEGFQQRGGVHSGNQFTNKMRQGNEYQLNQPFGQNVCTQSNYQKSWDTGTNYNAPNHSWNSNYNTSQNCQTYSNNFSSDTNSFHNQNIGNGKQFSGNKSFSQGAPFDLGENTNSSQSFYNKKGYYRGSNCNRGRGRGFQQNHNQGNGGNHKKNQKQKVPKRELPENNKFFCDTCDRGFPTEEKYKIHTSEHQKCTYEGCSYVAAPKLVQLHMRLQHSGGMAKKIWNLESEEDIQKWKDERRKNFPTAENIARKNTLLEEKKARGELIQTKYFGKMKGKQYNQQNIQVDSGGEGEDQQPHDRRNKRKGKRNRRRKHFTDGGVMEHDRSDAKVPKLDNVAGETDMLTEKLNVDDETKAVVKITGTMVEGEKLLDENKIEINKDTLNQSEKQIERSEKRDKQDWKKKRQQRKAETNNSKRPVNEVKIRRQPSLLEKLLANDIRHERNVILQCVHYIVKKNFFGIGQTSGGSLEIYDDNASITQTDAKQPMTVSTDTVLIKEQ